MRENHMHQSINDKNNFSKKIENDQFLNIHMPATQMMLGNARMTSKPLTNSQHARTHLR